MSDNEVIQQNMIALAKRRKGNSRSKMLKMIMPHLSHDTGEQLAKAIETRNVGKFKTVWDHIKKELANKISHFKSESSGFDLDELYDSVMDSISSDQSLLNGSGVLKEELRTLLSEGVVDLDGDHSFRIFALENQSKSGSSLREITFRVRTEIYSAKEDSIIKSFNGIGKLTTTLFDQLLLAKAYAKK